jgi:hypothetical protein
MKVVRSSAVASGRLYPRRNPWYSFLEAESTPGHMVPSVAPEKNPPVTPPGIDPETFRLVAQRLNHYATPGPVETCKGVISKTQVQKNLDFVLLIKNNCMKLET